MCSERKYEKRRLEIPDITDSAYCLRNKSHLADEAKSSPLFCKLGVQTVYETIKVRQMWLISLLPPKMCENFIFISV